MYENERLNVAVDQAESTDHVETLRLIVRDVADVAEHWMNLTHEAVAEIKRLRRDPRDIS